MTEPHVSDPRTLRSIGVISTEASCPQMLAEVIGYFRHAFDVTRQLPALELPGREPGTEQAAGVLAVVAASYAHIIVFADDKISQIPSGDSSRLDEVRVMTELHEVSLLLHQLLLESDQATTKDLSGAFNQDERQMLTTVRDSASRVVEGFAQLSSYEPRKSPAEAHAYLRRKCDQSAAAALSELADNAGALRASLHPVMSRHLN